MDGRRRRPGHGNTIKPAALRSAARPRTTRHRIRRRARFAAENAKGGVEGRKLGSSAPTRYEPQRASLTRAGGSKGEGLRAVPHARSPNNLAIWDYLNAKKVPRLRATATRPGRGHRQPLRRAAARIRVRGKAYAESSKGQAQREGPVLYQNDGFGTDCWAARGGHRGGHQIVAREVRVTDPPISADAQDGRLGRLRPDITTPSSRQRSRDRKSDWKRCTPHNVGASKKLVPARGLENAKDIVSMTLQGPEDRRGPTRGDEGYKAGMAAHGLRRSGRSYFAYAGPGST